VLRTQNKQDVANTFAPSVGAKALTMRQALLVAAVFEFAGAVLMVSGSSSSSSCQLHRRVLTL
jgi:phosphate/sulfate permease